MGDPHKIEPIMAGFDAIIRRHEPNLTRAAVSGPLPSGGADGMNRSQ